MPQSCELSVIIRTLANERRAASLQRAIASIREQDEKCRIIVVINGSGRDEAVVAALEDDPAVHVISIAEANLIKALAVGVAAVETPFFSVLDDDDILLPGACRERVAYMNAHPQVDALVTPGEYRHHDGSVSANPDYTLIDESDPVASLMAANWLASCGAVFRRTRIGPEMFAAMPRYVEWTYLAFQLARHFNLRFLPGSSRPHFAVFDTYPSVSKTLDYVFTMPANIARLRDQPLPREIGRMVSQKISNAAHTAATRALDEGMLADAWRFHLDSLREKGGMKYLSFTRHLLLAALRPRKASD